MALSKRSTKALCGIAAGAALLVGLAMSPALAGGAPAVADAAGGCSATGRIDHQWPTGQNVTVTVTNTAATPATKWSVTWQLAGGQRIVTAWNAVATTTGTSVTAVNASWNGNLAPGASTTFGMQLSGNGPVPAMSCTNDAVTPTSPPPSDGTDVYLTLADNQRTLTVFVGQTIHVDLRSDFRPPTVSGPALSHVHTSGGYPTGQPMRAVYRAVAFGSVDVTTQTDHACHHQTPPCGAPVLQWIVHLKIVGPVGDGRTVTVTTANNQGTVALNVGDTLVVSLPAEYQPVKVVPAGVLTQLNATGGYPTGQPFLARYAVTAPGEADLTSITDAACIHGPTPSPTPRIPWKVHATVTS
jgi:hypothetical protein